MRVAVIDQTGDKVGGAQLSLELFLRYAPADLEPSIVFLEDGPFSARIERLGIRTQVVPIADRLRGATRENVRYETLRRLPATIRPLVAALRASRPDVVYTNGVKAHLLGSLCARLIGRPSVVHHRDILAGAGRAALLGVLATCSRARIATSASVARCYPLPNTTVVDNPVELSLYRDLPDRLSARRRLGIEGDEPVAAIVGRINRWKGIDRFLRALAAVNRTSTLRGLVVGAPHFRDADYLPELRALRSQLGLDELVTFVDWIDDTRAVYAAADVNVNASEREPFGRTVIEAAATGVPSVCFDDAGVAETMIDGLTGLTVRAGDDAAFARALEFYATDREARTAAGLAARIWSGRFDAALHARRVAELLRGAASARCA